MIKRIKSLVRFELNITLDNKIVLLYTLIFPMIFLCFNLENFLSHGEYISGYWAYIIVSGTLNGIIAGTVNMRESNFLKMFSYIAKSKLYVFFANLIAQTIILELELLFFNIFSMLLSGNFIWGKTIYCFLISLLFIPLCGLMMSPFLVIRMKQNTYNVFLNGYLLIMLLTAFIKTKGILQAIIVTINPFAYFSNIYDIFMFNENRVIDLIVLSILAVIYLIGGIYCVIKMPIRGITSRY